MSNNAASHYSVCLVCRSTGIEVFIPTYLIMDHRDCGFGDGLGPPYNLSVRERTGVMWFMPYKACYNVSTIPGVSA